jgi:hypothetical protein
MNFITVTRGGTNQAGALAIFEGPHEVPQRMRHFLLAIAAGSLTNFAQY